MDGKIGRKVDRNPAVDPMNHRASLRRTSSDRRQRYVPGLLADDLTAAGDIDLIADDAALDKSRVDSDLPLRRQ